MIYKIRVILDTKDSVFRDIEIREKQTLWNLHLGIKSAFSLPGDELSSFYFSDEEWSEERAIPLEDMSDEGDGEIMSDIYLSEGFPEKGAKMLFKYGFIDLWEFFCELIEVSEEKKAVNYPITVYRFGSVPLKAPTKSSVNGKPAQHISDDFDADLDSDFTGEDDDEFDDDEFGGDYYDDEDLDNL